MVNYQQAKIYKIESNISGKIYIGSTCKKTLAERMSQHRSDYKRYLNGNYHYISSFDIIKDGDYDIILIESFPCDSKDQLYSRERYWTNELDCVNKCRNQGLFNELGEKEYRKEYYEINKIQILEHNKEYREINKDKINEKNKEYYEQNINKILKYQEEYRDKNKEKINEKHQCECGGCYTYCHKAEHTKTNKHQNYLKNSKQ